MNNSKTRYQIKKSSSEKWEDVSERTVMETLADHFYPLYPILSQMLEGKEIITPHESYRRIN
jgi:hypothetical protein